MREIRRNWFITGCSRGLGLALSREVLARGDRLIATARDPAQLKQLAVKGGDRVLILALDVTNTGSIDRAAREAEEWFGGVDILVNNAGQGIHGAVEEVRDIDARRIFDVNVFGQLAVMRALLPGMRKRRRGHIVNMSSVSGLVGAAGTGLYSATKFAVEGLSEAMAHELRPLGIGVTVVEPGPFRTDFNGSSLAVVGGTIADYEESATQRTAKLRSGSGHHPGDPAKAASVIFDAVTSESPPLHLVLGRQAYQRIEEKIQALHADMEAWRARATRTDFTLPGGEETGVPPAAAR